MRFFKRKQDKKREALIEFIQKYAGCVITGEAPDGTRVIVLGKDTMTRQLEEIAERKEIEL